VYLFVVIKVKLRLSQLKKIDKKKKERQ